MNTHSTMIDLRHKKGTHISNLCRLGVKIWEFFICGSQPGGLRQPSLSCIRSVTQLSSASICCSGFVGGSESFR